MRQIIHITGRLLLLAMAVLTLNACQYFTNKSNTGKLIDIPRNADGSVDYNKMPIMAFKDTRYDFGKIPRNAKVRHAFAFTNAGHAPLIISDVHTSCGCTTPSWPKHVIGVNQTDSILVEYNSEGRPGVFNKGITIVANTYPSEIYLAIKGVSDK